VTSLLPSVFLTYSQKGYSFEYRLGHRIFYLFFFMAQQHPQQARDSSLLRHRKHKWIPLPMFFVFFLIYSRQIPIHYLKVDPHSFLLAQESIQPLTEMSTRNISWSVRVTGGYDKESHHFHVPVVSKSADLNLLEPCGLYSRSVQGLLCLSTLSKYLPVSYRNTIPYF